MTSSDVDLRDALIDELIELAADEPGIVVLDADVSRTSRTRRFRDTYPDRFFDMGVAEQDMLGTAAGLAAVGRIPVAVTFAVFATLRAAEPLRTSICYPRLNVKVIGGYAALSDSKDGATHQSIEDIAIARSLPNLAVLSPSDPTLAGKVMSAAVQHEGPVYIRLEYGEVAPLHDHDVPVAIGRGYRLRNGHDITIASYGTAVHRALEAAGRLAREGIEADVLDMACLKPLDTALLLASVSVTGALVTLEDHNIHGGLASAAALELLGAGLAPAFQAVAIADTFTESAAQAGQLHEKYGVTTEAVVTAARSLLGLSETPTGGPS